jgi:hypothetical protein
MPLQKSQTKIHFKRKLIQFVFQASPVPVFWEEMKYNDKDSEMSSLLQKETR